MSTHEPMTAEARALHAMLDDDWDEAERILRDFLPGELRELERACGQLGVLCADVRCDPMQGVGTDSPEVGRPGAGTDATAGMPR
jgi:hypothetical protein